MVLNNKAIPAYSLEAETGVSRDRISKLRRGDIKFENMSLKTIMKIQKWIDDELYVELSLSCFAKQMGWD